MLPEATLREVLITLPSITVHGPWSRTVAFRLLHAPPPRAPAGGPPQPLWPGGAPIQGARFTPRASFATVYLASDHHTALAEVQAVLQPRTGPPLTLDRQPWVVLSVDGVLTNVLDLADPDIQAQLGSSLAELTGDWAYTQETGITPPTQVLGRVAYESGAFVGLFYASARDPGKGRNVAVFADRLRDFPPSHLQVIDPSGRLSQRLP
jgi:RES domain-containing protein